MIVYPGKRDLNASRVTIGALREEMEFRPTVVIVLLNCNNDCFIGKMNNPEMNWSLPQGEIENGESPVEAGLRELSEELGIEERHINEVYDLEFTEQISFPEGRADKRGFTKGKLYFCIGVVLHSSATTDVDDMIEASIGPERKITKYRWSNSEAIARMCVLQPRVLAATNATREKGRKVLRPAIRTMMDLLVDREVLGLDW